MKTQIHSTNNKAQVAFKWDQIRKQYPDEVKIIQDWFNRVTNTNSQVHFYNQPIWQNDLAIQALYDDCGIKVETEPRFVPESKEFRYIYACLDGELFVEPEGHYGTKVICESFGIIAAFKWLKYKRENPDYLKNE